MAIEQNTSVFHDVPVMIQPQTWACWYTSFQMVVKYEKKRGRGRSLKDPSQVPWVQAIFAANQGIGGTVGERERVANALGFGILFASMTTTGLWQMLSDGPVIYAGRWPNQTSGHFVVITGITEEKISVNNPATGYEEYDYGWFAQHVLVQTQERPLIYPLY